MTARRIRTAVLALTLVTGCAWWGERSDTTKGAVYGTGGGAAAGAAIGAILGGGHGAAQGAAIGAAVGGLAGTGIGYYMDKQKKEMQAVLDRQDRLEQEGQTLHASLSSDVLFTSGSAQLQPGAQDKLGQVANVLDRYPRTQVEVVGHTDNVGNEQMNETLSERRARAVRDVLVQKGVDSARVVTRGAGEGRPVATNATPEGRAMNRRVELTVRPDDSFASQGGAPSAAEPH